MTAKDYLSQAFWLDKIINNKLEQASNLRELATRATSRYTAERVSGTPDRYPMENAMVKLIDLEREINADIDKLVDLKQEISGLIEQVSNFKYRIVLEYRYIKGKTWEQIAKDLGYNVRWVFKLHGSALVEISKLLEVSEMRKLAT